MKLIEDEKCPRCGKLFSCSKSGKCWCFEVDISAETQEMISRKYQTCLCPDCLSSITKGAEI